MFAIHELLGHFLTNMAFCVLFNIVEIQRLQHS